jgi:hypothetical protein
MDGPLTFKHVYIIATIVTIVLLIAWIAGVFWFTEPLSEGHKTFLDKISTFFATGLGFLLGGFSGYIAKASGSSKR